MVSRVCQGICRRKRDGRGHEGYGQYQSRCDPANRHRRYIRLPIAARSSPAPVYVTPDLACSSQYLRQR
jgi:hypothetical protein